MSPIDDRGGSLTASPRILNQKKKKKINTENQKIPITTLVTSLPEKLNPNITAYTEQISKTKSNSSKAKPNTDSQSDRGVYLKKKKKSPIHKPKPSPSKPNPETHGHVAATPQLVVARPSLQIGDRRSQIGDRSAPLPLLRCSVLSLRPSLKIFLSFSLFFSHWNEKMRIWYEIFAEGHRS